VHRVVLVVALLLGLGGCRQIAGLEDLSPPNDAAPPSDAPAKSEGGPGCSCVGCTMVARDLHKPQSIVAVGKNLYWVDPGEACGANGLLMTTPIDGGPLVELAANLASPVSITTDGENVYFYEIGAANVDKLVIGTTKVDVLASGFEFDTLDNGWVAPSSSSSTTLLEPDTSILAVAGGEVYFPIGNLTEAGCEEYELARVSTQGGPVERILGTLISKADAGCDDIPDADFLPDSGGTAQIDPVALVARNGSIYWANEDSGYCGSSDTYSVWKIPLSGGSPLNVTSGLVDPVNLVVSGTKVYVVDDMNADVESFPASGGSAMPVVGAQMTPWAMAADSTNVYWTSLGTGQDNGTLVRLPLAGGAAVTLEQGLAAPAAIAVDDTNIYWVDTVCDAVFKAPK
jgi:hypothetical protein